MTRDKTDSPLQGTRLQLLLAGGKLFAKEGFEGTSIRVIAEEAGANIASVNYHFGSKENLLREALAYAIGETKEADPRSFLEEQERFATPQGRADLLYDLVRSRFAYLLCSEKPEWYGQLILRCLVEGSPLLDELVESHLAPEQDVLEEVVRRLDPDLDIEQSRLFSYTISAQAVFYVLARRAIWVRMGQESYDPRFLESAVTHVARIITASLGLPEPTQVSETKGCGTSADGGSRR